MGDCWLGDNYNYNYEGPGYVLKFSPEDFKKVFSGYSEKENLYLGIVIEGINIEYWDSVRFVK